MAQTLTLQNDAITVLISVSDNGVTKLDSILPSGHEPVPSRSPYFPSASLPLVELRLSGEANASDKSAKSMVGSYIGTRLRYKSHSEAKGKLPGEKTLVVVLHDEKTGVTATKHLSIFDGLPFLRSSVTVKNESSAPIVVNSIPSFTVGGMGRAREWWNDYRVSYANNTWFRETNWQTRSLPDVGLDDLGLYSTMPSHMTHLASLASFSLSNRSSFSTQRYLPMGYLSRVSGTGPEETWIWQVESSASWKWELGDYNDNLYLAASGPSADDHDWREKLAPGEETTSLTACVGHLFADRDAAFASLTQYRRRIRRPHVDHERLPIIFNDYMNCLMGDPTEDKIHALIGPVAAAGAEYFVIDAGWYADDSNWWDDVGEWEPSQRRFPSGFKTLLDKIRTAGLCPGLWIEPEVIGIRNSMAKKLPNEAFFQRDGQRITERGRYQLDFRHPAVRQHLDEVFNKYVRDFGVGYFKFDYNIEVTQGTDANGSFSAGAGQLGHNRAYLAWVSSLLDRYADLVIENCSSGAQRMDYAMLAVHTLQSTSDQQDPVMYSAMSATVHTAVTPEQGATWAYPQASWSDEVNALTVVNSLLGRVHLSGRLDIMSPSQLKIVYDGMKVYREIRSDIPNSEPFFPIGLAGWHDHWLALGMKVKDVDGNETGRCYVAVWRRGGARECVVPVKMFKSNVKGVNIEFLYPKMMEVESGWDQEIGALKVKVPETSCARLFKLESQ
ncbi:hypothetical protein NLU13_8159 [Sarocladium strictum]|uniref:alpha-galactosidase n=1 Tax=Sarocladium strictum TaxID=5046 RepID=A0AA39GB51_SARSR|nr:hypothetical protein NLU13_8159 [Sarocladium strictum]